MVDPRTRIGDVERERATSDLSTHYAEGRLEHEEYDERLDAIWTARTQADLRVIFDDLPQQRVAPKVPVARGPSPRRRFPLMPVLALLILLSIVTRTPLWLLIFVLPLMHRRMGRNNAPGGMR